MVNTRGGREGRGGSQCIRIKVEEDGVGDSDVRRERTNWTSFLSSLLLGTLRKIPRCFLPSQTQSFFCLNSHVETFESGSNLGLNLYGKYLFARGNRLVIPFPFPKGCTLRGVGRVSF